MAEFNFKQIIYAGMVTIAGVDERVSTLEQKHVNEVFDKYIQLSKKEKKEVIKLWEAKQEEGFTKLLIDELKAFPKRDQIEAYTYIMKFISWTKTQYNKSKRVIPKGIDPERAEMNMYYERADMIRKDLDFTDSEYTKLTRTKNK
ncbi:MAG: hypothetical protein K8R58_02630 [Bacteroidales bacterium]|nr:hypothetical protein [Bacteroidales bacterium]